MSWTATAVIFTLGFLAAAFLYGCNIRTRWKLRHIPGPRPMWLFGNLLDVPFGQFHTLALSLPRKYGPVTKLFMGPSAFVIITDPELTKEVAVRQFAKFRNRVHPVGAPASRQAIKRRESDILWARNKYWTGLRAACEPLFHSESLRSYAPLIHEAIDGMLGSLSKGKGRNEPVQVSAEFGKMSLDAIGSAAFGVDFDSQQPDSPLAEAAKKVMAPQSSRSILQLLVILIPELKQFWALLIGITSARVAESTEKVGFLTGTSTALLENSRRERAKANSSAADAPKAEPDFFGHGGSLSDVDSRELNQQSDKKPWMEGPPAMQRGGAQAAKIYAHTVPRANSVFHKLLGAANKETGQPLSDLQIASVGNVFILAGYDTTAIGLSWTLYELASRPGLQARIITEVDTFGQQKQPGRDDMAAFPFTEACFHESMRLHPPVNPLLPQVRQAEQDVVLGGYRIPKGTVVVMNCIGQHMDERHFPEPEVYRPERFLKDSADGPDSRHPFAYVPFGAGPHKCIGYRFAMEEAVFALVRMFQRFTFRLSEEHHRGPLRSKTSITLPPEGGVWVHVQPRAGTAAT